LLVEVVLQVVYVADCVLALNAMMPAATPKMQSEVNFNWGKFGPGSSHSSVYEPVVTLQIASKPLPADAFSIVFEGLLMPIR
jgi:hypothetical protein